MGNAAYAAEILVRRNLMIWNAAVYCALGRAGYTHRFAALNLGLQVPNGAVGLLATRRCTALTQPTARAQSMQKAK